MAFLIGQARETRPDIVIGWMVHPLAAHEGRMAARLRRARFAFESRDLWRQTLVERGAMRMGSPGERPLLHLESFRVRRASTDITRLLGMRADLSERGLLADQAVYGPRGVLPSRARPHEA